MYMLLQRNLKNLGDSRGFGFCLIFFTSLIQKPFCELLVTSSFYKSLLIIWGHVKQHNRLFGINTSVTCFKKKKNNKQIVY